MGLTETDESCGIKTRLLPTVASVAVGVLPAIILIAFFGVPRRLLVGWGVLSYVLGVTAFKMPL